MPQEYQFMTGPGPPRARPVPTLEWEKHEKTIRGLWKVSTLKELMDVMRVDHGFEPSHKQYVLQLQKWGMHKYTGRPTRRPSTFKEKCPPPSPGSNRPIVLDTPPSQQSRETKSSRTSEPAPLSFIPRPEVSPPDRESPNFEDRESWEVSRGSPSDFAEHYSSLSRKIQDQEAPDAFWMCFCQSSTTNAAILSAKLFEVSTSTYVTYHPTPSKVGTRTRIERIESAAEYFLHKQLVEYAFQLYVLLLEWALSHKGLFCQCARDLVHRARVGITLSAFGKSDLEAANKLLEQTKGISPPGRSTGPWLLYESIFTWRLYSSRGVLQLHGERDAIRRLQTRFQSLEFSGDLTPYKTLGVMTCYEIQSIISGDGAKLHIVNLELGMRHDVEGETSSEYSSQGIHPNDLTSCLQWILDLPSWRQSDQMLTRCARPGCAYFQDYFSICWTQLKVEGKSVALSWFHTPKSTAIRPTELLAVMVHLVNMQCPVPSEAGSINQTSRNLLLLDESRLLSRFNEMRFSCTRISSLDQLSRKPGTGLRCCEIRQRHDRYLVWKHLRVDVTNLKPPS